MKRLFGKMAGIGSSNSFQKWGYKKLVSQKERLFGNSSSFYPKLPYYLKN